ncbi:hypothetical protein COBT_003091 [Conglomerata obtusa]
MNYIQNNKSKDEYKREDYMRLLYESEAYALENVQSEFSFPKGLQDIDNFNPRHYKNETNDNIYLRRPEQYKAEPKFRFGDPTFMKRYNLGLAFSHKNRYKVNNFSRQNQNFHITKNKNLNKDYIIASQIRITKSINEENDTKFVNESIIEDDIDTSKYEILDKQNAEKKDQEIKGNKDLQSDEKENYLENNINFENQTDETPCGDRYQNKVYAYKTSKAPCISKLHARRINYIEQNNHYNNEDIYMYIQQKKILHDCDVNTNIEDSYNKNEQKVLQNDENIFIQQDLSPKSLEKIKQFQSRLETKNEHYFSDHMYDFTNEEDICLVEMDKNHNIHDSTILKNEVTIDFFQNATDSYILQKRLPSQGNFTINLDAIKENRDKRTTCMIKNIPNKYTQKMLLEMINEHHAETFDFLYLRIDFRNKCNVGYAFINFLDCSVIPSFYTKLNGKGWKKFRSNKIAQLTYASIQGIDNLIRKFKKSNVLYEQEEFQPKVFYVEGPNKGMERNVFKED